MSVVYSRSVFFIVKKLGLAVFLVLVGVTAEGGRKTNEILVYAFQI